MGAGWSFCDRHGLIVDERLPVLSKVGNPRSSVVSNWARNQRVPDAVHQPASTDEVARIVRWARGGPASEGWRRPFLYCDCNDRWCHVATRQHDTDSRRPQAGQVHVQAGATLRDFCRNFITMALRYPTSVTLTSRALPERYRLQRTAQDLALAICHQRRCDDVGE